MIKATIPPMTSEQLAITKRRLKDLKEASAKESGMSQRNFLNELVLINETIVINASNGQSTLFYKPTEAERLSVYSSENYLGRGF